MEWRDEALVLATRAHGETSALVEVLTRDHGRHLGLVRGGRARKLQPVIQPGNSVAVAWRARLEDHLGTFSVELIRSRAGPILADGLCLAGLALIAAELRLLPERDPHGGLYEEAIRVADGLHDPRAVPALVARFELALLAALGFGLDLQSCAATGAVDDLVYVSPRSARAVSAAAGAPYHDRLLALPAFLRSEAADTRPGHDACLAGLRLTGHFLDRHLFELRPGASLPERTRFVALVAHLIT